VIRTLGYAYRGRGPQIDLANNANFCTRTYSMLQGTKCRTRSRLSVLSWLYNICEQLQFINGSPLSA